MGDDININEKERLIIGKYLKTLDYEEFKKLDKIIEENDNNNIFKYTIDYKEEHIENLDNLNMDYLNELLEFCRLNKNFNFYYEWLIKELLEKYIKNQQEERFYEYFEYTLKYLDNYILTDEKQKIQYEKSSKEFFDKYRDFFENNGFKKELFDELEENNYRYTKEYINYYSSYIGVYNEYTNNSFYMNLIYLYNTTKPNILDLFYTENLKNINMINNINVLLYCQVLQNTNILRKQNSLPYYGFLVYFQNLDYWKNLIEKYPLFFKYDRKENKNNNHLIKMIHADLSGSFLKLLHDNNLENTQQFKDSIFLKFKNIKDILRLFPDIMKDEEYNEFILHIANHNLLRYRIIENVLPKCKNPLSYYQIYFDKYRYLDFSESISNKILQNSTIDGLMNLINTFLIELQVHNFYANNLKLEEKTREYNIKLFNSKKDVLLTALSILIHYKKVDVNIIKNCINNLFKNHHISIFNFFNEELIEYLINNCIELEYESFNYIMIDSIKFNKMINKQIFYQYFNKFNNKIPSYIELFYLNY